MSSQAEPRDSRSAVAHRGFSSVMAAASIVSAVVAFAVFLAAPDPQPASKAPLRAQAEASRPAPDIDRRTVAQAPEAIRALPLETMQESATLDNQPGQVAGAPTEACCFATACQNLLPSVCIGAGGFPGGPSTVCGQFDCGATGACCFGSECGQLPALQCASSGGTFQGFGTSCTVLGICAPPTGACCADGCLIRTATDCASIGGPYLGDGTDCRDETICQPNAPCEHCGSVPHWIDRCQGGFDLMPTGALVGISTDPNSCVPNLNLVMAGPVAIRRTGPLDVSNNFAGVGLDDSHLDVLDTEMVSMQLTGGGLTLRAGAGMGHGLPLRPSLGAILETGGDTSPAADSFFDVFFEIEDTNAGILAYNQEPLRVTSNITCVPPDATYFHPTGCVKLFSSQGVHIGYLTSANHSTYPKCGDPGTGPCDQPHDTPFCNDAQCCSNVCERNSACCTQSWNVDCARLAETVCVRTEACCFPDGTCLDGPTTACLETNGTPQGPGTSCATFVCPLPKEACCLNGVYADRPRLACLDAGG
ncbi:MAG: hypothetical protein Q7R45_01160, partial [Sulfuricaulis sp.]|nr:hypothetical protein [Sulfuricaulis sp.]